MAARFLVMELVWARFPVVTSTGENMKTLILILALMFAAPALAGHGHKHHTTGHRHHDYRPQAHRYYRQPNRDPYYYDRYAPRYYPAQYRYPVYRISDGLYYRPYSNRLEIHFGF
jgi:hypothetical protein